MKRSLILIVLMIGTIACSQKIPARQGFLKDELNKHHSTNLIHLLSAKQWNELFPNRYGMGEMSAVKNAGDFYSFSAFVKAAGAFPEFLAGTPELQKRELAAFLANIAQETSGGWDEAPGGYFKWGLYFLTENASTAKFNYVDSTKKNYPPVKGKSYFGRGPKQLSWNYNYGQFSEAWYGSKDTLLMFPERLATDPVLSFASAIWFWMTPQYPKPSCHQIMTGQWQPTEADLQKGRRPGFGATVNVINGGVECGQGKDMPKTVYRYKYYKYFCRYFHINPGDNIECSNQTPFGQ